jgi:hypothetical protein
VGRGVEVAVEVGGVAEDLEVAVGRRTPLDEGEERAGARR